MHGTVKMGFRRLKLESSAAPRIQGKPAGRDDVVDGRCHSKPDARDEWGRKRDELVGVLEQRGGVNELLRGKRDADDEVRNSGCGIEVLDEGFDGRVSVARGAASTVTNKT